MKIILLVLQLVLIENDAFIKIAADDCIGSLNIHDDTVHLAHACMTYVASLASSYLSLSLAAHSLTWVSISVVLALCNCPPGAS